MIGEPRAGVPAIQAWTSSELKGWILLPMNAKKIWKSPTASAGEYQLSLTYCFSPRDLMSVSLLLVFCILGNRDVENSSGVVQNCLVNWW